MSEHFSFPKIQKRSLKSYAYDSIKQAIIHGDLKPGEWLREADIAAQMGINRAPVREAFRQLAQEGMIYSHPYRGTVVLEVSPEETEEVFVPTRRIIENYVAKKASTVLVEDDFAYLEDIVRQMELAATEEDLDRLTDLDMSFHSYLIEHASSPSIMSLWNCINARTHSRLLYQGIRHGTLLDVMKDHRQYLKYIRSGDPVAIENYLQTHIY